MITNGSRWLMGNGNSMKVLDSRWILRPKTFKIITSKPLEGNTMMVSDPIDFDLGYRKEVIIWHFFFTIGCKGYSYNCLFLFMANRQANTILQIQWGFLGSFCISSHHGGQTAKGE